MKTNKLLLALVCVLVLSSIGCTKINVEVPPSAQDDLKSEADKKLTSRGGKNGIIHSVSLGGADICIDYYGERPGCDANFSLIANMAADGTVSGQYSDRLNNAGGIHGTIDCLTIVGKEAWVSGIITSGKLSDGTDLTGKYVTAKIVDNGKSGDEISFSYISNTAYDCSLKYDIPVYKITGQAVIK